MLVHIHLQYPKPTIISRSRFPFAKQLAPGFFLAVEERAKKTFKKEADANKGWSFTSLRIHIQANKTQGGKK